MKRSCPAVNCRRIKKKHDRNEELRKKDENSPKVGERKKKEEEEKEKGRNEKEEEER